MAVASGPGNWSTPGYLPPRPGRRLGALTRDDYEYLEDETDIYPLILEN